MRKTLKIALLAFVLRCFPTTVLYAASWFAEDPSWVFYFGWNKADYRNCKVPADISKEGCLWGSWVTFAQKIEAIQIKARDISNPINLFYSKDFLAMCKHPLYYKQAILEYLADKNYSLEQKTVAIYAASSTDLYKSAYELYKKKKIDLEVLSLIFAINVGNLVIYSHIPEVIEHSLGKGIGSFIKQIIPKYPRNQSYIRISKRY